MIQTTKINNHLQLIIPDDWDGLTIEQLLKEVWQLPKKQIHLLRMDKAIRMNDRVVPFSEVLHSSDCVLIENIFNEHDYRFISTKKEVQILYEDDFLLVANKPAGMSTHPNTPDETNTLTNGIVSYLQDKNERGKVQHIHRLDKDTSGAILFAKSSFVGSILDRLLEERKIKRTYTAVVHGKFEKKTGTIQASIGRDRHHPTRRRVSKNGQDATTHYEVIAFDARYNRSQILCRLDTGRTHQIRVHMSDIGHPLIGDVLYGGEPVFHRQALHAKFLSFIHPLTLEEVQVEAPYLDDFPDLLR